MTDRPEDAATEALAAIDGMEVGDMQHLRDARRVLVALEEAGWSVKKLEQMTWSEAVRAVHEAEAAGYPLQTRLFREV